MLWRRSCQAGASDGQVADEQHRRTCVLEAIRSRLGLHQLVGSGAAVRRCPSTVVRCFGWESASWGAARKPRQVSACLSRGMAPARGGFAHLVNGPSKVCVRGEPPQVHFEGVCFRACLVHGAPRCSKCNIVRLGLTLFARPRPGAGGPHESRGKNRREGPPGGQQFAPGLAATSDDRDPPASIAALLRGRSHSGR